MNWSFSRWRNGRQSPVSDPEPRPYAFEVIPPVLRTDFLRMVTLPPGIDKEEWIATHALALFHNIDHHYSVISELCTADSCPTMNGPNGAVFLWVDERGKKIKCSAPQYIDYVMAHCQQLVTAQDVFPTKYEQTFSSEYRPTIMKMMRLLWHVVSHIYHSHYQTYRDLELAQYLNMMTLHMVLFVEQFNLVEEKELTVLNDLIGALKEFKDTNPDEIEQSEIKPDKMESENELQ